VTMEGVDGKYLRRVSAALGGKDTCLSKVVRCASTVETGGGGEGNVRVKGGKWWSFELGWPQGGCGLSSGWGVVGRVAITRG